MRQYLIRAKKHVNRVSIYWEELIEADNKNSAINKMIVSRPKSKIVQITEFI